MQIGSFRTSSRDGTFSGACVKLDEKGKFRLSVRSCAYASKSSTNISTPVKPAALMADNLSGSLCPAKLLPTQQDAIAVL